ncbi:hypothetical protein protein [Bacillus cereus G9241]|nr:hypothetical protein protein [Bacillus cereus G9241]
MTEGYYGFYYVLCILFWITVSYNWYRIIFIYHGCITKNME